MSDFDLFNQALNKYKKTEQSKDSDSKISDLKISDSKISDLKISEYDDSKNIETSEDIEIISCSHKNISTEKGVVECIDCGEEISKKIQHTKEWRYYGQEDSRRNADPNRVQQRKSEERNIYKDVDNMGFSDKIISDANKIYFQVTQGKIFRGNSRKAIVFACIFHAYKISGKPQSHEKLIGIFNLDRKTGLKGLKHINLYAPKNSQIRTTYITPINLVQEIMEKFSATDEQTQEVINLYHRIKNKSSRLNRSRPQSVASGLVYFWICSKNKDISLKQFTKKVSLSELTVNKIAKEITEVIGDQEVPA